MKDTVRLEFYLYSMRRFMWSYCCLAEPTNFCRNAPRVAILWCIFFADCRSEVGGMGQNSCRAKCACKVRPTPSTRFCYHSSLRRLCGLRHAKHAPQCHAHLVRKKPLGCSQGFDVDGSLIGHTKLGSGSFVRRKFFVNSTNFLPDVCH